MSADTEPLIEVHDLARTFDVVVSAEQIAAAAEALDGAAPGQSALDDAALEAARARRSRPGQEPSS